MEPENHNKCLKSKVKNVWERQKTFFDVAAAQSSSQQPNPDLPDSLLLPLVSVSDPCQIHSFTHYKVDWAQIEARCQRDEDVELVRPVRNPDSPGNREESEEEIFVEEIVDLVRTIRKYNDAALSSSPTWIEKLAVEKIAKNLIMIQNYLPDLLKIEEIVYALLFDNGTDVMENMLPEMPENLVTIVNTLTSNRLAVSRTRYRNLVIGTIMSLYPYFAKRIVAKLTERRSDCAFGCRLAVDHLTDTEFLHFMEVMLTEKEKIPYITVVTKENQQILPMITNRLLRMADGVLYPQPHHSPEICLSPWCTSLAYCLVELLIASKDRQWAEPEMVTVTKFIFRTTVASRPSLELEEDEPMDTTMTSSQDSVVPDSDPEASGPRRKSGPPVRPGDTVDGSPFGDAHECFVLAALIAVPSFTQYPLNNTGAVQPPDRAVEDWVEASRRRVLTGEKITSPFSHQFLFVHSCIFASKTDFLTKFVEDGMKQKIDLTHKANHLGVLKNIFRTRGLTDPEMCRRSLAQVPGPMGSYPWKTINILAVAEAYINYRIDIRPCVEKYIQEATWPLSTEIIEIVRSFAHKSGLCEYSRALTGDFLLTMFQGDMFDEKTLPRRLLTLLYMFYYREASSIYDGSYRASVFSFDIFRQIPIRYLSTWMDLNLDAYQDIRFKLMMKMTIQCPYSLPTPDSMNIIDKLNKTKMEDYSEFEEKLPIFLEKLAKMQRKKQLKKVLETISQANARYQLSAISVYADTFMTSLDHTTPPGYEQELIGLMDYFEHLNPFPLFFTMAEKMIEVDEEINGEDVVKIPNMLFRCDRRILSSPPHFYCFIRTLNFFNKYCRTEYRLRCTESIAKAELLDILKAADPNYSSSTDYEGDRREKELLVGSYLDSQQSITVHALIEVCDAKRMGDDPSDFNLREKRGAIRLLAYDYIHRTFLDHENLIRVVLFQKLPLRQIGDLVEGIPSLYPGLFFIPEMIGLADNGRRFFAVCFVAQICKKYRVQEALDMARLVLDFVHTFHKYGELPSDYKIWKYVAPALMTLALQFPSLADSINRLLMRVATGGRNRLAVRCGVLAGDPRHDEHRLIEQILSFLDRNSTKS